jgi:small subunit ribosomal protein S4e
MAKHGESKHAKRSVITKAVVIPRKKYMYYVRALPGKHPVSGSIALLGIIRDLIKIANNAKEARYLIKTGEVKIDGKKIREEKCAVGFGDLVEIKGDKFVVNLDGKGKLILSNNELVANVKKLKVVAKEKAKGGRTVLRFNDGRNLLVSDDMAQVGDTVLLNLTTNKIEKVLPLEQGKEAIIFKGRNAGLSGKIKKIDRSSVELEKNGESFIATADSCFVL